jgi:hypothetical protein
MTPESHMYKHILDDDLEAYSMHRMSVAASAPVEEHLLVCESCQVRLTGFDQYAAAVRGACHRMQQPKVRTAGASLLD